MQIEKSEFEPAVEHLKGELAKIRTGRANPGLVEDIPVDFYGQKTPLKQLANVSVPEARQLLVLPWDKNALAPIEKAIRDSDLGLTPNNEGDKVRIIFPDLTSERREELAKLAKRSGEEARVKIRNLREEIWREVQRKTESGELTEDDKFRLKEKLQEIVDEFNKTIQEVVEKKEEDIKTI
jgi:ribosome recycling factor